jgi:ribose transport system ATP-binding protein
LRPPGEKASRLRVESLSKSYFGVPVLQDVSFKAYAGEVLAIVGENGSGKSTTLNVLTGIVPQERGEVFLDGEPFAPASRRDSEAAGVAFIQQELNIFPNLTVAENLFLVRPPRRWPWLPWVSRRQMHARAREILSSVDLHVEPGTLAGTLSAGERQLLAIARALSAEARVFILDEPTSSLTARESARLFEILGRLLKKQVAVIFVSHNLEHVLELAEAVLVLRDGQVTLSAKTAGLLHQDLILAMVGRPIDTLFPQRQSAPQEFPALEVEGVGEPGVMEDIHFRVARGEILGIAGLMGAGRTELARALFGLDPHSSGVVRVNGLVLMSGDVEARIAAGVAFLTEDRRQEGLMLDASVADNVSLSALQNFSPWLGGVIRRRALEEAIHSIGGRVNLKSGEITTTTVRTLSGGNQQKVVLGRWLLCKPRIFILDEPTRGVDVGAKEEIYRLLAELADAGMTALIISSELEELMGLCDRILVMRQGSIFAEFPRARFDREDILRASFGQRAVV